MSSDGQNQPDSAGVRAEYVVACTLFLLWLFIPPNFQLTAASFVNKENLLRFIPLICLLSLNRKAFLFAWHWCDGLVLFACAIPFISGVSNGLGIAFSLNEAFKEVVYWFVPYFLGRAVFANELSRDRLATVAITCGLLYLPFSVVEVLQGPVFTAWLSGDAVIGQLLGAERGATFRPSVFLPNGFVLTMFLVLCSLCAVDLGWQNSRWARLWWIAAVLLGATVVACKSLGSIALLAASLLVLELCRWTKTRWWIAILFLIAPSYLLTRASGLLDASRVYEIAKTVAPETRANSLNFRLQAEDFVFECMQDHWWLGYGDYGLYLQGRQGNYLDGFWLFAMTRNGLVSVAVWQFALLAIVLCSLVSTEAISIGKPVGTKSVFAVFLGLCLVDSLFNYFGQAPQMLLLGSLAAGFDNGTNRRSHFPVLSGIRTN